jgi:glycosyltransferase involved in cell wall biosynthesis
VQERRAAGVNLVAYSDATAFGGAEQALANLLAFLDPTFEITVLAVDEAVGEAIRAARKGAALQLVPKVENKWDVRPIMRHLRAVRSLRPDIFHANLWTTVRGQYGVIAALLARGVRTVVVEQAPLPTNSALQRLFKRLASRRLSAHVAVGERSARAVEEAVGLPPGSIRTIYNGVPDLVVDPLPRRANGPVIGAVGRLSPEKGFDLVIRALCDMPDATLVVVGDGSERSRLQALARELGLSDRVELVGWSDEPRRYLPGFDAFVLPSRQEGFPLAVVEAMLAGLPVVAADVGSVGEAVLDGETGFLVPPDDADALAAGLRQVLDHPELGRRLGSAGRARAVERFTAEAMARAFEDLYREILA